MPSTSKKQHNFMSAIANNPSFAKKVGISQSVGKDFSAADKGRKFGRGGMAAINKQNTQQGSMDTPFKSLKKFGGMKSGGKVKRYAGEDESLVDDRPFAKTNASEERTTTREVPAEPTAPASAKSSGSTGFNAAFKQAMADSKTSGAKTFEYGGKKFALGYAKPETPAYRDEGRNVPRREAVTETVPTPAVTGRAAKESKSMPSDAQKERNAENFAKVTQGIAALTPVGRGVRVLGSVGKAATEAASASRAGRAAARAAEEEIGVGASGGARAVAARTQPPVKPPINKSLKEAQDRIIREGKERNAFEERARDTLRGEGGLKKGGSVTKHMGFRKGGSSMKKSEMGMKAGGKVKRYDDGGNISKEDVAAFGMPTAQKIQENRAENKGYLEGQNKYPAEARLQKDLAVPARIARKTGVYLNEKYGDVKGNVKGMLGNREALRELRGSQLSREAALGYKKGGMPMKDGKPAFMQKKMNMGGMAKYAAGGVMTSKPMPVKIPTSPTDYRSNATSEARDDAKAAQARQNLMDSGIVKKAKGGGIESKGKTKGTVIRMASGGSVSARADGIAQRGKTKFKMC